MELKNIKRSITIEGYKFTPKAIKRCGIVYIGTAEECDAYAEEIDNKNNTDCAFVGCLGSFNIREDGMSFRGAWCTIPALRDVYFVEYKA